MPYPKSGEAKSDYISRFMESSEAQSDFPDKDQRLAVAYSMWERRDNAVDVWPKEYECNFIEPGLVFYQDLGACKVCGNADPGAPGACGDGKCDPTGEHVLVRQPALAAMAKSFVGKPVIDKAHKDVTPGTVANGEAEGIVTRVWQDEKSGWWKCRFIVWDPETQRHCESAAYSVSCAYEPTAVDSAGGSHHNVDYQQEILDGRYTHLAVVTNPRYEDARIQIVNSKNGKGEKMSWRFWNKGSRKNALPVDLKQEIEVDGKKVPMENLLAAAKEEVPAKPELSDDTVFEHEGKEYTLGKLKENYLNKLKNADDKCPSCMGSGKKPAENAEPKPGEKEPLPDPRASGAPENGRQNDDQPNPDAAKKAAEEADRAAKEKQALELKQAEDAKKAEELKKAEEERKNAEEAEKAKKAEEAEKAKKAEEEKKEEERRNAGRKAFADLRNAAHERGGEAVAVLPASLDERLAVGREKYGSGK